MKAPPSVGLLLLVTAATAAAAPPTAAPHPADKRSGWGGWYVGSHVGYTYGRVDTTLTDPERQDLAKSFGSLHGGVLGGYAFQLRSRLVLGPEADIAFPNFLAEGDLVSSLKTTRGSVAERVDCIGRVRGRLGYAFDRSLLYGAGGFAWSLGRFIQIPRDVKTEDESHHIRPGWTLGVGFESAILPRWTTRLEYAYDRLESTTAAFAPGASIASTMGVHSVRLGLSWQLSWLEPEAPRALPRPVSDGDGRPPEPTNRGQPVQSQEPPPEAPIRASPAVTTSAGDETSWSIHGQFTFIEQGYFRFHSPYEGANSLSAASQARNTTSATLFLGRRLWPGGGIYFNPELMQGFGLNDVHGVAAFPNGEAQKSSFPVPRVNAARLFLSQTFGLGGEKQIIEDGPNQIAGERSVSRITATIGKFAVTDYFLVNSYAGEPRTTFLNWNLYGGGSYDWTMDRLSWTWGGLVDLNQKRWAVRAGCFLLPIESNANQLDTHIPERGQCTAELELRYSPFAKAGKLLLFGWRSHGNMGSYSEALAEPPTTPGYPDITLTRRERTNYGFVASAEQAISTDLGVFSRASWSPGRTEIMGWTDCDESFSLGTALRGTYWGRRSDTVGVGGVIEGLSPISRRYFAAGGMGILIGDGKLNYRPEMVLETYYSYSPFAWAALTLDYQFVADPGYNADRGPVSIFSFRIHVAS